MAAGNAVHVSNANVGDHDFQVWQRKNKEIMEPFATGLFAKRRNGKWQAYLLDFQDVYHPHVFLRKETSGIIVIENGKKLGVFDESQETFKRESDGAIFAGSVIGGDPPGVWWLEP